jgi:hypothetical protein
MKDRIYIHAHVYKHEYVMSESESDQTKLMCMYISHGYLNDWAHITPS